MRFFDAQGAAVPSSLGDRVIGLSLDQMRTMPMRLGIAGGPDKIDAVRAVVDSGLINALVTDTSVAEALLAAPGHA